MKISPALQVLFCFVLAALVALAVCPASAQDEGEEEIIFFEDDETQPAPPSESDTVSEPGEEVLFPEEDEEVLFSEPAPETPPKPEPKKWDARISLGGYWENEVGVDTKREDSDEDMIDFRSKVFGYGSYRFSDRTTLRLSVRTLYWLIEGGEDRHTADFDLYEGYLSFRFPDADFYAGQMIVKWGTCDLLSPTDAVNPLNLTSFVDPDPEDHRIPLPMARSEFYIQDLTVELLYIPIFQSAVFNLTGGDLALVKYEEAQNQFMNLDLPIPILPAVEKEKLVEQSATVTTVDYQEQKLIFGEAGGRLGYRYQDQQAEFIYFNTREDFPHVEYRANAMGIEQARPDDFRGDFERYELYGVSYKASARGWDFRAEFALSPHRSMTTWEEVTDASGDTVYGTKQEFSPWNSYAVEIDYLDPDRRNFFKIGMQHFFFSDAPENLIYQSEESYVFLIFWRGFYLDDELQPEIRVIHLQSGEGPNSPIKADAHRWKLLYFWMASPRITYKFLDRFSITVGANLYYASDETVQPSRQDFIPLNVAEENNQAFLSFRYYF